MSATRGTINYYILELTIHAPLRAVSTGAQEPEVLLLPNR